MCRMEFQAWASLKLWAIQTCDGRDLPWLLECCLDVGFWTTVDRND